MAKAKDLDKLIRKYALKNAIDYGKADVSSVLGKIIPSAKGMPVPEVRKEVESVVAAVNKMGKSELESEYSPFEKEFDDKARDTAKKTAKPNMELEGATIGEFVTRWPPEPSGYLHVGHAKPIFLEDEFRKIYKGKLFLYFDDTNPEKEKQEYVDADKRDLEWLGIKFDTEYYASDNLEKIYEYAKKLIRDGNAYVCSCSQETIKSARLAMEECEHRKRQPKVNLAEFEKMLLGKYDDGAAVLRFKGDMKSQNTAMRDPTIARIKKTRHYRQGTKYPVWPTYDLAAPIMDSINGVTHVLRSKEYELRDELDTTILKVLGLRIPRIHPFSRFNIIGNTTHKREIRELVSKGVISGWDDPRLMTLSALRRRGIVPGAIRELALKTGITKADSALPFEMLLAENKKIIDEFTWHLYFVPEPVKLTVRGAKEIKAKMKLLRSGKFGNREYSTNDTFFIPADDAARLKDGDGIRLKDLIDVKVVSKTGSSITVEPSTGATGKIVQWVSDRNYVECSILVPGNLLDKGGNVDPESLRTINGYAESYVEKLEDHEIVQFERFGYCILDDKKKMQFIFISK